MKNAVPGCISCCLSSFLPSFPVSLFFVLYYVLKGARELASVWPRPACGPPPRGVHQCPWVITQALTNAIHWGKVTLKIVRAAWIDDGSVVEFTSGEQRWFSTSQLCSISARGLLCSSVAVKAQYSCGSSGWRLSCATTAKLCHMLRGGFMVRVPLTTRDQGETESFWFLFLLAMSYQLDCSAASVLGKLWDLCPDTHRFFSKTAFHRSSLCCCCDDFTICTGFGFRTWLCEALQSLNTYSQKWPELELRGMSGVSTIGPQSKKIFGENTEWIKRKSNGESGAR